MLGALGAPIREYQPDQVFFAFATNESRFVNDLVSYPARVEGLVNMDSCMARHIKMTLYQIQPGGRSDKKKTILGRVKSFAIFQATWLSQRFFFGFSRIIFGILISGPEWTWEQWQ